MLSDTSDIKRHLEALTVLLSVKVKGQRLLSDISGAAWLSQKTCYYVNGAKCKAGESSAPFSFFFLLASDLELSGDDDHAVFLTKMSEKFRVHVFHKNELRGQIFSLPTDVSSCLDVKS